MRCSLYLLLPLVSLAIRSVPDGARSGPQTTIKIANDEPGTSWSDESAAKMAEAGAAQGAGSWEPAMLLYQQALEKSPNPPTFQRYVLHNNIGWSLYNMGQWAAAEEEYRTALKLSGDRPPTDHAYINLATLYKAQGRWKATIKVYQAAVELTKQLPTWAALGLAYMREFRVEEAITSLQEGLRLRGDSAPAAQEVHNYLGTLNVWRRRWSSASQHFIKSVDLGLPSDATGCRAGRWQVVEGWTTTGNGESGGKNAMSVTVHTLPMSAVTDAIARVGQLAPPSRREGSSPPLEELATQPFLDSLTNEKYRDGDDGKEGSSFTSGYRVIELRNVIVEDPQLTSLVHPAPECKYYVGEHTASALPPWNFGIVGREQNHTFDKQEPFPVQSRSVHAPVFAISNMLKPFTGKLMGRDNYFQTGALTKMLLLLKAVVEPEWGGLQLDWKSSKLFVPKRLSAALDILKDSNLLVGKDGTAMHHFLKPSNRIVWEWTPGLRYQFKRLILLDSLPPEPTTGRDPPPRNLKLALHRTRQSWRVHYDSLYRLTFPRRGGLMLHRAVIRAAAGVADGTATADAPPRILYYSRSDPSLPSLVVKGEKNLIDALERKFGAALAIYRSPESDNYNDEKGEGTKLIDAAKTFGAATAIIAPQGVGLANILYCEYGTPLFLFPTYDAASPDHIAPPPPKGSSSSKKDGSAAALQGDSITDSPYTYIAAAAGMPVNILSMSKAYVAHGNYSMPPYLSKQAVDSIARDLQRLGRWKPPPGSSPPPEAPSATSPSSGGLLGEDSTSHPSFCHSSRGRLHPSPSRRHRPSRRPKPPQLLSGRHHRCRRK